MGFEAVESVEDAVDRSKSILTPFDFMTWTRLAVIMLFLGGTGASSFFFNMPFNAFSTGHGSYGESSTAFQSQITGQFTDPTQFATPGIGFGVAAAVIGVIVITAVVFLYLNSLTQFVMFRSIRDKEVMIRKNIGRHYVDAAKYFLYNIGFSAVVLAVVVGWIGSFLVNPIAGVLLTLAMIPIMLILVVFNGLVHDFVLQKVIETKSGFIESISDVLSVARSEWEEVGVYLVVRLFISYAVGLMTLIAVGIISVLYLIVFGLLAALLGMVASPLALIPAFIGVVLWLVTLLYVTVPFKTYLYSYFVEVYEGIFE